MEPNNVPDLRQLRLRPLGGGRFGESQPRFDDGLVRMYGGRLVAQALWSAAQTFDLARMRPHSLHANFARSADPAVELEAAVEEVNDGRSFALRRVTLAQADRVVVVASVSAHAVEAGEEWAEPLDSELRLPEVETDPAIVASPLAGFEVRAPRGVSALGWPRHPFWIRTREDLDDDPALHLALLAYVSDAGMPWSSRASGTEGMINFHLASLDHALWIHRPPRLDRWHQISASPMVNTSARGLIRGAIHDFEGHRVATVVQETLIRPPSPARSAVTVESPVTIGQPAPRP